MHSERNTLWAFLYGNFLIGTGVMLVPGLLVQLATDLQVSVPAAGTLISIGAIVIGVTAPILASVTASWDRRSLLAGSLAFYGLGFVLAALAPHFTALLPIRAICLLAAGVFTPQAAAALALLLPAERRAGGITFIFIGWSIASIIGLPLSAWLGAYLGWRMAFGLFALPCLIGALWVYAVIPRGLKATPLPLSAWVTVARHPSLIAILLVTVCSASGQFALWAYIAPFVKHKLAASATLFSGLLMLVGAAGLIGNMLAARAANRSGPALTVHAANAVMVFGLFGLWLFAGHLAGFVVCGMLWGLGVFASNSSQQARLAMASPELAGASIALNTSMIYVGQAIGASVGGAVIATSGYDLLPLFASIVMIGAVLLSLRAGRLATAPTQKHAAPSSA